MPEAHRQRQHEDLVKQVAKLKGELDLVFVGDSITQGWGSNGQEVWKSCYGGVKSLNLGMASNRVEHALWRVQNGELEGISPKVVVILIGVNNIYQRPVCTAAQVAEGVALLINTIHIRSPRSTFLLLGVFPSGDKDSGYRTQAREINALLARYDDGKIVRFLDLGEKLLEPDGSASAEVLYDKLHLSAKGYAIWAAAMNPLLSEMVGVPLGAPIDGLAPTTQPK